jgi:YVTN family beta-propeller protein
MAMIVAVIDGARDSILTKINMGRNNPYALVYNSFNNKIYCALNRRDTLAIINGFTDSIIRKLTVGYRPLALVYNPISNKIYCATSHDSLAIIDGVSDSIITTVYVPHHPSALIYNSTNNKIYCAGYWGSINRVAVIDGVSNSVVASVNVGENPIAMTYNPQQNRVYVANEDGASISVIRDVIPGMEEGSMLNATSNMLKVYPNPAKAFFTLRLPQSADRSQIKIYDVTGKVVKELESSGKKELRISLDGIKNGIYFVKVGNEMVKEKLVVTR